MIWSHHRRGTGTLYSYHRQWFMTKTIYLAWFCLSNVNSSIWGLISNTTMGPSGHGKKPPSSKLGTLCSYHRQWFMTKIDVLRLILFVRRQFKHLGVDFKHTYSAPVVLVRSHHRRGRGLCTAVIGNGLWPCTAVIGNGLTKIHVLRLILFVRRQFIPWGFNFKHHTGPQ